VVTIRAQGERAGRCAGALLAVAGAGILRGIITAEALYSQAYSTKVNTISDLGGTRPPERLVLQPSAAIFDVTMIVTGVLIISAAFFLHRWRHRRIVTVPVGLLGIGVLGVGVFPGHTDPHPLFAMLAFVSGGVAGVLVARVLPAPIEHRCCSESSRS
jgi:hypothetical membrane protein